MAKSLIAWPLHALTGWEFEGPLPEEKKYVLLAAPHTSNWDGLLLLSLARSVHLDMRWMIKREWLRGPMGIVLRRMGAIGIDRSGAHHVVDNMVEDFQRYERLVVVIPPEGTRKRADHWKSGFYHIAMKADVPVVCGYMDYARKRAGLSEPIRLTGNVKADMDVIRAFYEKVRPQGHSPEDFGPIRLRDEGDGSAPATSS
jgi:1-acyl-sn-glycerol-3-phosphate acyltransferase